MEYVGFVVLALGARPYGFQLLLEGPPCLACGRAGKLDVEVGESVVLPVVVVMFVVVVLVVVVVVGVVVVGVVGMVVVVVVGVVGLVSSGNGVNGSKGKCEKSKAAGAPEKLF